MTLRTYSCASCLLLFVACKGEASKTNDEPANSGGVAGDGDASDTGGASSGGVSNSTGGSGEEPPSGGSSTGGTAPSGGTDMGGAEPATGGADPGTGGAEMGGAGMGGAGPDDDYVVPADAVPSAGCSLPAVDPSDLTSTNGPIFVSTPRGYDGSKPLPLILGLPAVGGQLSFLLTTYGAQGTSVLAEDYVIARATPWTSDDSTWEGDSIERFDEVYRMVEENVCFDKSRVFGVGNEGGGRYLTKHVCTEPGNIITPKIFRALALVGFQSLACEPWPNQPLLFLSSVETEASFGDPDGALALARFKERKSCGDTSTSAGTWPVSGDESFNYVCEDIDGCSSDLRFCNWTHAIDWNDIWLTSHNEHVHRFFADYL